jgi:two-component system phosphate regulon sensor histidine kinase PhoR
VECINLTAPIFLKNDEPQILLFDAFPDPIILLNQLRDVVYTNKAALDMLDVCVGRNLALSFREPDILKVVDAVLNSEGDQDVELSMSLPVIITYKVRVIGVPSVTSLSETAAIMVFSDISLETLAEKMRRDFIGNVSHELRSPIASLIGFIETLQGPAKEDLGAHKKFLEIMSNEASRMARMVDDLLSLSRVEARERLRPKQDIDITELLGVARELFISRAQNRSMSLNFNLKPHLPIIQGDRDELMEIFQNLIDNAIKYGDENSNINISGNVVDRIPEIGGSGVAISVENTGEVIDANKIPRLTERFYRIDKGRSRNMGGTGLGLAIVKHIINHHRGRLLVESKPNGKTIFTVFLPLPSEDRIKGDSTSSEVI